MGHAVNSTGFRLFQERHWVEGVGTVPSVNQSLHPMLDRFLSRLFGIHLPHHLYSHLHLYAAPTGRLHLHLHFYSHLFPFLLRRRRRRIRRIRQRRGVRSNRFYRFLRWRELCRLHVLLSTVLSRLPVIGLGFHLYLHPVRFSPSLLLRSFIFKVRQQHRLVRILNSFLDRKFIQLSKQGVVGILFRAAGRFSRRQRASTLQVRRGTVPFATLSTYIDRFSLPLILKYGRCSLQVWVAYRKPLCLTNRFLNPGRRGFRPPRLPGPVLPPPFSYCPSDTDGFQRRSWNLLAEPLDVD